MLRHIGRLKQAVSRLKGAHREQLTAIAGVIIDFLRKEDLLELGIAEVNAALGEFVLNFTKEYKEMEEDA